MTCHIVEGTVLHGTCHVEKGTVYMGHVTLRKSQFTWDMSHWGRDSYFNAILV